jgi:hypothetical protein
MALFPLWSGAVQKVRNFLFEQLKVGDTPQKTACLWGEQTDKSSKPGIQWEIKKGLSTL